MEVVVMMLVVVVMVMVLVLLRKRKKEEEGKEEDMDMDKRQAAAAAVVAEVLLVPVPVLVLAYRTGISADKLPVWQGAALLWAAMLAEATRMDRPSGDYPICSLSKKWMRRLDKLQAGTGAVGARAWCLFSTPMGRDGRVRGAGHIADMDEV